MNKSNPNEKFIPGVPSVRVYCGHHRMVALCELQPHPKTPLRVLMRNREALKKIVLQNGVRRPIIVSNRSGLVVGGAWVLVALRELGASHAPCENQDFQAEANERINISFDTRI